MTQPGATLDLFDDLSLESGTLSIGPGAVILRRFVGTRDEELLRDIEQVVARAPFRHMVTPGGLRMSVAMSNCGALGWVSDRSGYRYDPIDPLTGQAWPAMPESFRRLAADAAEASGHGRFEPDACLINRYEPGTRLSLHQDRDESDFSAPIVSVSLGLPTVFLFGGTSRSDRPQRHLLWHGDVVVWGGPSRLYFHGVGPLAPGLHPLLGAQRINLTFRKAR